jgi:hypothetical protein
MLVYETMEIVVTPDLTYMIFDFVDPVRRVFTDGRIWPSAVDPLWMGYSIGHWEDESADGKYRTLAIETRNFKGPRIVDGSGIPLHADNQTIIKERLSLDPKNADVLHDEITLIDHAFTRPWTVLKTYRRAPGAHPDWPEDQCDSAGMVMIGKETYYRSGDGTIMPTNKDQPPPDLRYFKSSSK